MAAVILPVTILSGWFIFLGYLWPSLHVCHFEGGGFQEIKADNPLEPWKVLLYPSRSLLP